VTNLVAEQVVRELDEIVKVDGGRLRVRQASEAEVELELDLSESSCPECVLPKAMLLEIITAKLATAAPDVGHVQLHDPREPDPSDQD
jgi:Fe-S cluster biogenesis protein NfuA